MIANSHNENPHYYSYLNQASLLNLKKLNFLARIRINTTMTIIWIIISAESHNVIVVERDIVNVDKILFAEYIAVEISRPLLYHAINPKIMLVQTMLRSAIRLYE